MKKKLLFITAIAFLGLNSNAQLTITSANWPVPGSIYYSTEDTTWNVNNITFQSANASAPWNFSNELVHGNDYSTTFMSPSAVPNGGALAASADLAMLEQGDYSFLSTKNDLEVIGTFSNDPQMGPMSIKFSDPLEILPSVASLNTGYTDEAAFEMKTSFPLSEMFVDSMWIKFHTKNIVKFSAEGTLTVPSGTYNSLRSYIIEIDSSISYIHNTITNQWIRSDSGTKDTSYSFKWYGLKDNKMISILELDYDNMKMLTDKTWFTNVAPASIFNKNARLNISVYPTLVVDKLYISSNGQGSTAIIYDIFGRQVYKGSFRSGYIDLQNLKTGAYFCKIINGQFQSPKTVKIIKK